MNFSRTFLAAAGVVGLAVAFAGNATVEFFLGQFTLPAADIWGRVGFGALGAALLGVAGYHWARDHWPSRQAGQAAKPGPATPLVQAPIQPLPHVPPDVLTVHYHRSDGQYDGWRLHAFGDGLAAESVLAWPGRRWDGVDSYGAYWRIVVADDELPLGIDVHKSKRKDPYGPLSINPSATSAVFLAAGRSGIYPTASAALTAPADRREIVLHYRRPDNDYDGWQLWCYDGPADPPAHWEESLQPELDRDEFGIVFRIPLAAGAPGMRFILHNEDVKDHLPNGLEIVVKDHGLEIWVEQGKTGKLRPTTK